VGEIEGSGQRLIALWWVVMRKIMGISKQNRITSLADFIASR
jgi:Na+/proline symporter